MNRLVLVVVSAALLVLVGGGIVLATVDLPAPSTKVEKPVPEDRLAH